MSGDRHATAGAQPVLEVASSQVVLLLTHKWRQQVRSYAKLVNECILSVDSVDGSFRWVDRVCELCRCLVKV